MFAAITLAVAVASPQLPLKMADYLIVDRRAFSCVIQHIRDYDALGQDPVLIDLAACPPHRLAAIPVRRSIFPRMSKPTRDGRAVVFTMTKSQLDCIAATPSLLDVFASHAPHGQLLIPIDWQCP